MKYSMHAAAQKPVIELTRQGGGAVRPIPSGRCWATSGPSACRRPDHAKQQMLIIQAH